MAADERNLQRESRQNVVRLTVAQSCRVKVTHTYYLCAPVSSRAYLFVLCPHFSRNFIAVSRPYRPQ